MSSKAIGLLETRGLARRGAIQPIDLTLRRGEVTGLGGLLGSGRTETARLLFCRLMLQKPNVLVLDEPTNHLDLDSIHWLRDFLIRYTGTLIVISHDRHFLNSVCDSIADVDYQELRVYSGNYDAFEAAKAKGLYIERIPIDLM